MWHRQTKPTAQRIQICASCGYSTMASEPVQTRLLWAVLILVLPVTLEHTTAWRSPALAFSAAVNFALKRSVPCSTVLRHSASSRAAVVLVGVDTENSGVVLKRPHPLFFPAPRRTECPLTSSPNITHFGTAVSCSLCALKIPRTGSDS